MVDSGEGIDWGMAEALAFGTLVAEGEESQRRKDSPPACCVAGPWSAWGGWLWRRRVEARALGTLCSAKGSAPCLLWSAWGKGSTVAE